ncbi:UNVERIFIED_CONTAM: hypothetical protein FKN15_066386 [Acipenser sinensis]
MLHLHYQDPTAAHYMFQDDPYLFPKTSAEFCLMPEAFEPQINDISEDALNERIRLRQVKAAVDIFDQLIQGGTTVSLETTNKLLDLLCFYGDRDPVRDDQPEHKEADEVEAVQEDFQKRQKGRLRKASDLIGVVWRENNNAERIFNLMPEKNERSFCSLIRGMVKYGAYTKAFSMYADLLNNRMTADVHTFNALIAAAPNTREKYNEKWELIVLYYPNSQGMMDLLQALDTDSRLDLIPQIWKDIKQLGHTNKADLVEEVLALMARDKQSPEVQASFADCSLAVKSVYEVGDRGRTALEWTASALGNITSLLLRAGRMQEAW